MSTFKVLNKPFGPNPALLAGCSERVPHGLAMVKGVERGETLAGTSEEFYVRTPHVRTLRDLQEAGKLGLPIDVVTDAKSLYDTITGLGEPKPTNEGTLLSLL